MVGVADRGIKLRQVIAVLLDGRGDGADPVRGQVDVQVHRVLLEVSGLDTGIIIPPDQPEVQLHQHPQRSAGVDTGAVHRSSISASARQMLIDTPAMSRLVT